MAILIIGETKSTKRKVYEQYKPILEKLGIKNISLYFNVFTIDLENADFNIDLNNPKSIRKSILEMPKIKYDCIILNNVLEHLLNLDLVFRMCLFILKPKGYIIIRTDNAMYFPFYIPLRFRPLGLGYHAGKYQELYNANPNDNHYHIFTKWHIIALAKRYRLRVLDLSFGIYKYGIKNVNIPFIKYFMPRMMMILQKTENKNYEGKGKNQVDFPEQKSLKNQNFDFLSYSGVLKTAPNFKNRA